MIEILVALIGASGVVGATWLQNRKTRKAVAPVSNGFAGSVTKSLLDLHAKIDRIDNRLDTHLEDHERTAFLSRYRQN